MGDTAASQGKVVIIGLGYVGLPVAMRAVECGYDVIGIEVDGRRLNELTVGRSYVGDISDTELGRALASGRFLATDDYGLTHGFDVAVVTVPTPLRDTLPDLSYVEESARELGPHIAPGATVILESTTYPGTTENVLAPILEERSGLTAGTDFHVGYSPERIDPGNARYGFVTTPKVVSGLTPACLVRVAAFYDSLIDQTVAVSSPKEAELTKLLENTFRHVNIALVNEMAIFAEQLGIDIWEAIEAAASKPFGYMKFLPGPGVGGHCLPVDPSYLSWEVRRQLDQRFRFVELANDINDHMPHYVVERIIRILNDQERSVKGSRILIIGLAYKEDTNDMREAPSVEIVSSLRDMGATVLGVDEMVSLADVPAGVELVSLDAQTLRTADVAVLITEHSHLERAVLESAGVPVLDTRGVLSGPLVERL